MKAKLTTILKTISLAPFYFCGWISGKIKRSGQLIKAAVVEGFEQGKRP